MQCHTSDGRQQLIGIGSDSSHRSTHQRHSFRSPTHDGASPIAFESNSRMSSRRRGGWQRLLPRSRRWRRPLLQSEATLHHWQTHSSSKSVNQYPPRPWRRRGGRQRLAHQVAGGGGHRGDQQRRSNEPPQAHRQRRQPRRQPRPSIPQVCGVAFCSSFSGLFDRVYPASQAQKVVCVCMFTFLFTCSFLLVRPLAGSSRGLQSDQSTTSVHRQTSPIHELVAWLLSDLFVRCARQVQQPQAGVAERRRR